MSGVKKFYYNTNSIDDPNFQVKTGDIISVEYNQVDKFFFIDELKILNSVMENPLANPNSSYTKLNKNGKKILSTLKKRQDFFRETRNFFYEDDFIEIHTPTLLESPGVETYIEPFKTTYYGFNSEESTFFLPTSPEFSLKEAIGAGLEKIFEIARVYRNKGENSNLHSPEFFMLEWYRAYSDYFQIMDDCFSLIEHIANSIYKTDTIYRKDHKCKLDDLKKVTVKELFSKYNINLDNYTKDEEIFKKAIKDFYLDKNNEVLSDDLNKDDLFFKFFLDNIECKLGFDQPTAVYEYPIEMCALSNPVKNNPNYGERFELYIFGIEIANGFGELTDVVRQKSNFRQILNLRKKNRAIIKQKLPERFLQVLKYGIPPCSGVALGLERLFMIFENLNHIKDTNLIETIF